MTEIITTINTKTITKELLQRMIEAGSSIIRINMSHTKIEVAKKLVKQIRQTSEAIKLPVQIMIDIPGPEVRIANLKISHSPTAGSRIKVYFTAQRLDYYFSVSINKREITLGDKFYLQDGDFEGIISEVNDEYLLLTINNNSILRKDCHFSIPGKSLHQNFISPMDKEIITETALLKPDFFALSFVHSAEDVKEFKDFYTSLKIEHKPKILTKIETAKSLLNLDQIIDISDYIYIARGDLGIEVSIPLLPSLQKFISSRCNEKNIPYFVATQMMESMVSKTSPSRAEISDIANAVFDEAQGVTLSDETAIGKHPIKAIKWMKMIIEANSGKIEENIKNYIL